MASLRRLDYTYEWALLAATKMRKNKTNSQAFIVLERVVLKRHVYRDMEE